MLELFIVSAIVGIAVMAGIDHHGNTRKAWAIGGLVVVVFAALVMANHLMFQDCMSGMEGSVGFSDARDCGREMRPPF